MKALVYSRRFRRDVFSAPQSLLVAAALSCCFSLTGCTTGEIESGPASDPSDYGRIVQTPASFETALKDNQSALAEGKSARDLALYNIGVILAHPSNPKKDCARALQSFRTLVTEHPRSKWVQQSNTWIQVLELQQKVADEKQRLAEDKRALNRERETLLQERQKLNYASEKSRQLDLEIDKRRRQSFSK